MFFAISIYSIAKVSLKRNLIDLELLGINIVKSVTYKIHISSCSANNFYEGAFIRGRDNQWKSLIG